MSQTDEQPSGSQPGEQSPPVADLGPPHEAVEHPDIANQVPAPVVADETLDDAPDEVAYDAVEELRRVHDSVLLDQQDPLSHFDSSYGMSNAAPGPVGALPYEPHVRPVAERHDEPAAPTARELKTLEDLYDAYPRIGDGSYSLRVVRRQPSSYAGVRIAGFLEDIYHPITLREFASRFGGGTYVVTVRGPGRSVHLEADGSQRMRTLTSINVEIPGDPIVRASRDNEPRTGFNMSTGHPIHPNVEMRRMELEAEERRRREARDDRLQQQLRVPSVDPSLLKMVEDAAERRGGLVQNANAQIIASLQSRLSEMGTELQNKSQRCESLREQVLDLKTEMATQIRDHETQQIRDLKERHANELRLANETNSATVQRMQTEHERRIADLTERAQRDREQITRQEATERERLRDDASRRERTLQDDFARREQMYREQQQTLRAEFERREDMIRRDYEQRYQQLERSNKRDLDVIKSSESTKAELAKQTAEVQMSFHQQRIQQLEGDIRDVTERAATAEHDLSAHVNKPLLQQVEETKTIAETLGLLNKDEAFDWKKSAATIVGNLVDKADKIAEGFGRAREQGRMMAQQAEAARIAQARANVAQMRQGNAPPMMTAGGQQRVQPPPPPPGMAGQPPAWGTAAGPPEPGSPPPAPPPSSGPPLRDAPAPEHHIGSPQPPGPTAPPAGGGAPPATAVVSPVQPDEPPVAPGQVTAAPAADGAQQPAAAGDAPTAAQVTITPEQVAEFADQLEQAIMSGIVTPEKFAKGFIDQVGQQRAVEVIGAVDPQQLLDAIAATPGGQQTMIATRQGRKFVHQLWKEAAKQLGIVLR